MDCDFIDLNQETINCKGVNFGKSGFFLLYLTGYWATWLPGYLATWLTGYLATWLPIVPYCVEWAAHGLPIVGSLSEV